MTARIRLAALLLLALPPAAAASPAAHLRSALETSHSYLQTRQSVEAAAANVEVKKALLKPQGNASASYSLTRPSGGGMGGSAPSRFGRGVNVSQKLFDLGSRRAIEVAELGLELAEHRLADVRQQILLAAYRSYLGAALARESLALIDRRATQLAEQLRFAESALDAGAGSTLGVINVKAQIASLRAERIDAIEVLMRARRSLASLSGRPADDLLSLAEAPAPAGGLGEWERRAGESPAVLARLIEVNIQEAVIEQRRGSLLPSVSLEANTDLQNSHTLGIQALIPLFSSGAATAELRNLEITTESLKSAYRQSLEDARLAVANAFEAMWHQEERILALTDSVAIARERLELTNASVSLGGAVQQAALDAESDLAAAELALLGARHAQLQSWLDLLAASGELDMEAAAELEQLFR